MEDKVLEFIKRRFKNDCSWTDGNCYYFALILKDRFSKGKIYYDVIDGHFLFYYNGNYYDWNGIIKSYGIVIDWNDFDEYDSILKRRIVRDCLL